MRNEKNLLDNFMPEHEKQWEAILLIDSAIKAKVEYSLEALARALSGPNPIRIQQSHTTPFERTLWEKSDDGTFFKCTRKHKIEARIKEFIFYGNNLTEIWCEIIDFWAGKTAVFPCGGANFKSDNLEAPNL